MSKSSAPQLQKSLGFWQGLALYLAAVLGTGILVIPSLAWNEAGPASLIVWVLLGFLGFALARSFAMVGAKKPDAGGIQTMISEELGSLTGNLISWVILFSIPAGAVAGAHIFADHLVVACDLPHALTPWVAWAALVTVGIINYFGLKLSASVQLALSATLLTLLTVFILWSLPRLSLEYFSPWMPFGWKGVGQSSLIIFWSFLGWEAIAHLAEEFENPEKDMVFAAKIASILVGVLYLAVAFVLIGTGSIQSSGEATTPMTVLASKLLGNKAGVFTGLVAALICLGTINAYMAGISRLVFSMSRGGLLPKGLDHLHPTIGSPQRAIIFLLSMYTFAIFIKTFFQLDMRYFFLIPNVAFLTLYTLGCYAAGRVLKRSGFNYWWAYIGGLSCLVMIPFAAQILWYHAIILILGILYSKFKVTSNVI